MGIGEHLDLHVAPLLDVPLDQHGRIAERRLGLPAGGGQGGGQLGRLAHDAHPLPAPAGGGLHQHRQPDLGHGPVGQLGVVVALDGRQHRHVGGRGDAAGLVLASHEVDDGGRRAHPHQAGGGDGAGEVGVLGEEPVAGVDRVGAGGPRGGEQCRDREVGLGRRCRAEAGGGVGRPYVGGGAVGVGVDRHRAQPRRTRRPDDAQRDLPPVGDEQRGEGHRRHIRKIP